MESWRHGADRSSFNAPSRPQLNDYQASTEGSARSHAGILQRAASAMEMSSSARSGGMRMSTSELHVDTSLHPNQPPNKGKEASSDPLTPRSRQALDSTKSSLPPQRSASEVESTGTNPLSPHRGLLAMLDSVERTLHRSHAGVAHATESSFVGRSMSALYVSDASSITSSSTLMDRHSELFQPSASSQSALSSTSKASASEKEKRDERSRCGAEICYHSPIRIRLNNHQCLRISAVPPSVSASRDSSGPSKKQRTGSQIDVSGNGLNGDDDQIFVLVNANMRSDYGIVRYDDVVALYCVGGTCKGRFLSYDAATQSLIAKKGPVLSNAEKWRLINPSIPHEARAQPNTDAVLNGIDTNASVASNDREMKRLAESSKISWERQRALMTSDKVLWKAVNAELFLSVVRQEQQQYHVVMDTENLEHLGHIAQLWEVTKANLPYDPTWNRTRGYLTGEALVRDGPRAKAVDPNLPQLSDFPPSVQETLIVDDLLYSFLGVEGRYVRLEATEMPSTTLSTKIQDFRFKMSNEHSIDPSIKTLAERCFPLGEYYLRLIVYVDTYSRYEYGQVNHAFCAALKSLIKEYTIVIAQQEHEMRSAEGLTIQKLWFYIQPSLRTMEMLSKLVEACRHSKGGGSLLSEIQRIKSSLAGDSKAHEVFSFLMERTSVPYLKMVERWIYHGDLVDPYDEFMVRRDEDISKEDLRENPYSTYWQDRYTLREKQVPLFLARLAPKILATGKYLNVFRTCHRRVDCPFAGPIEFASSESQYEELINRAHMFASQTLLALFVDDHDLLNRLISLKHYFLMDQGDFFVDFMDVAEEELKLRADKLALPRLESLLHLSLQTSTCASDPYKDDLVCFLSPQHLISQMEAIHERAQKRPRDSLTASAAVSMNHPGYTVIDALTLDYKVEWPLSLVISCGALTKYQMIFRHLFFCKHVERQLGVAWLSHQATKELQLRKELCQSFRLRQRMLHFQQNFVYYMMFEVISPRWHDFGKQLECVKTVDEILESHTTFLDICLKECLLTDPDLLRVLTRLMTVCTMFATAVASFTRPYVLDEETIKEEREAERDRRAEKKAREEAEAALAFHGKAAGGNKTRKPGQLKRRQSSVCGLRNTRITQITDDFRRALTEKDSFARITSDFENQFDSLLKEFMKQLRHRSLLQHNSHLSNLLTRLDYNGFYANQV